MTKRIFFTLLGTSLLLATTPACNHSENPEEYCYAHATATIADGSGAGSTNKLKALFEGGATTKDTPAVITWNVGNKPLNMLVYYPTTAESKAVAASFKFKSSYKGDLSFPYTDDNVVDQRVKYFATSGLKEDANITKGAFIDNTSTSKSTGVVLHTAVTNEGNVNMKKPGVTWPLISTQEKEGYTHLWSSVHTTSGGSINFHLFGNIFFVHFDNVMNLNGYDANSNDTDTTKRPKLTIESNGMAFGGSTFANNVFADQVNDWTVETAVNKVTYHLSSLEFGPTAKRQILPVWFRPMTPVSGEFGITITWEVWNTENNAWDKSIQKFRLPIGKELAGNKTMFADTDGRYYRMNVGISPKIGAEFGSNSFYILEINPPAFD